jgi:hypothetical protein
MKLKKNNVDPKILRHRLIVSIILSLMAIALTGVGILMISKAEPIDGAAPLHRYGFLWNEKVFSILQSNKRLSVEKPNPPKSKEPRVNGMVGLNSPLDLLNYRVNVEQPDKKLSLMLSEFYAIPKVGYSTDFRCIEGWSEETQFAGARFSDFLEAYKLGKKADGNYYDYVGLETPDGKYFVSIDMESMLHPQTVLAYEMNEHPLSLKNGAPLRLIIPIKYGIKSLKRIGKIIFSDTRPPDYWANKGYDWYSGL